MLVRHTNLADGDGRVGPAGDATQTAPLDGNMPETCTQEWETKRNGEQAAAAAAAEATNRAQGAAAQAKRDRERACCAAVCVFPLFFSGSSSAPPLRFPSVSSLLRCSCCCCCVPVRSFRLMFCNIVRSGRVAMMGTREEGGERRSAEERERGGGTRGGDRGGKRSNRPNTRTKSKNNLEGATTRVRS